MLQRQIDLSVIQILLRGAEYLRARGVVQPRAEADILLAHTLGISRDKLYLSRNLKVSGQDQERFVKLLQRRGKREPLAYVVNKREFMGLEFYVDERVLIPRPETEILAEKVLTLRETKSQTGYNKEYKNPRVLDLCTGSGALAISIAYYWPEAKVTAVDISDAALEVAKYNAAKMQTPIDLRRGDLFEPLNEDKFDIIVSNPPYVSQSEYKDCSPEVKQEPPLALLAGEDGLDFYRKIAAQASRFLCNEGLVLVEIGCTQGEQVIRFFTDQGFKTDIFRDYAGLDRIVLAAKE
ncbi:MAG: peptide chain release factor N(5)-glutamine methyltransferase [Peptococcaceae bacterium]|jgi:release factor glutamine methyltransferase|nr:peptide chain release factor N(5)-glutamine methyltransferase [Peptococcaceae bacterium]